MKNSVMIACMGVLLSMDSKTPMIMGYIRVLLYMYIER